MTKILKEIKTLEKGISEVEDYMTFLHRERRKHQPYLYKMENDVQLNESSPTIQNDSILTTNNQKILQTRSIITMLDNTIKETNDTHYRLEMNLQNKRKMLQSLQINNQ